MNAVSRRGFIKRAGAFMGAGAASMAGASLALGNEVAGDGFAWDEEYDVVVVGAGLAGATAAAAALA